MAFEEALVAARGILHHEASAEGWEELVRLVDGLEGPTLEVVMDYADGALGRWPPLLRTPTKNWLKKPNNPRRRLVRGLDVRPAGSKEVKRIPKHIEGLDVRAAALGYRTKFFPDLLRLLEHPALARLEVLDLSASSITDVAELTKRIAKHPIRELTLGAHPYLSDLEVVELVMSCVDTLEHLNLDEHYFRGTFFEELEAHPTYPRLTELSLVGCHAKAPSREEGQAKMDELAEKLGELLGVEPTRRRALDEMSDEHAALVMGFYAWTPPDSWLTRSARHRHAVSVQFMEELLDADEDQREALLAGAGKEILDALESVTVLDALRDCIHWSYNVEYALNDYIGSLRLSRRELNRMERHDGVVHLLALYTSSDHEPTYKFWSVAGGATDYATGTFAVDADDVVYLMPEHDPEHPFPIQVHWQTTTPKMGPRLRYQNREMRRIARPSRARDLDPLGPFDLADASFLAGWQPYLEEHYDRRRWWWRRY